MSALFSQGIFANGLNPFGGKKSTKGPAGQNSGLAAGGNKVPKGYELGQIQNYSPEQMDLFKRLFSQVGEGSYLSKLAGGDQATFDQIEAPAFRQFQELQGQTASRFSGASSLGRTQGTRRGSGFQNETNQQTSDFASQLASNRHSLQQTAWEQLRGMSNDLLGQRPYEQFLTQKPKSGWGGLIGGALGGAAGGYFGGPSGAVAGGRIGHSIGSAF